MTERVDDLAVELSPELLGEIVAHRGAGGERACPDGASMEIFEYDALVRLAAQTSS